MKKGESGTGERVLAWKGNPSPGMEQTHWPLRNLVSTVLSVLRLLCLPHQEKIGGGLQIFFKLTHTNLFLP